MKRRNSLLSLSLILALFLSVAVAQEPGPAERPSARKSSGTITPQAGAPIVQGSGTIGKIPKWTYFSGYNYTLGDSVITESNNQIGIGTASPTSKLTVQGMIETTLGGVKFPDSTIQTTAFSPGQVVTSLNGLKGDVTLAPGANITITPSGNTLTIGASGVLTGVAHDSTLMGNGTSGSPLGVTVPLVLSGSVENGTILSVINNNNGFGFGVQGSMVNGYGVRGISTSLNGVFGASSSSDGVHGQSSSTGFLIGGVHGSCTSCNGVVGRSTNRSGVLGMGDVGVEGVGSNSNNNSIGGTGMKALGGGSEFGSGGIGVEALGGFSDKQGGKGLVVNGGGSARTIGGNNAGGPGIVVVGGNASSSNLEGDTTGGDGVVATGGTSGGTLFGGDFPGSGVIATGGNASLGIGGVGVFATGGMSRDSGGFVHQGGVGIVATGGSGNPSGRAGLFRGDVDINGSLDISGPSGGGNLTVSGTKNFKIDHPLDPQKKYLLHAAIESSEVLNIYSGNIVTNAKGEAVVTLPKWFEVLNKDLRYQLTVIGTFAQAIIAEEIKGNSFVIKTNAPSVKVSWQVTGVRSDAVMRKHPFKAEEDKPEGERGTYLNPDAFDEPDERGAQWARNPEMMQQLTRRQVEPRQTANRQPNQR